MVGNCVGGCDGAGDGIQIVGQTIEDTSPDSHCFIEFFESADSHDIYTNFLEREAQRRGVRIVVGAEWATKCAHFCTFSKPILESKSDGNDFEFLASSFGPFACVDARLSEGIRSRMPITQSTDRRAISSQEAHTKRARVGDDIHAGIDEALQAVRQQSGVLQSIIRVRLNNVDGLSCFAENHLRQLTKDVDRVATNADILQSTFFVADATQLRDGSQHFRRRDKLAIVAIDHIKIIGFQALTTSLDTLANPLGRIIESVACNTADFCENEILISRVVSSN